MKNLIYSIILMSILISACTTPTETLKSDLICTKINDQGQLEEPVQIDNSSILITRGKGTDFIAVQIIGRDTNCLVFLGQMEINAEKGMFSGDEYFTNIQYLYFEPLDPSKIGDHNYDCLFVLEELNPKFGVQYFSRLFLHYGDHEVTGNYNFEGNIVYQEISYNSYKEFRETVYSKAIEKDKRMGRI